MLLNLSKFSVIGTIVCGLAASGALVACSGVSEYPPAEEGGAQQQGNGGSANASGGTTPTGNGGSGTGGSNNGNGGSSNGNGGSSSAKGGTSSGSGGSSSAKGGTSSGSGGSSSAKGGSSSGTGGSASTGASFSQVQTIIKNQCAGCHFSGGQAPNLGTTGSTLYGTLTSTSVRDCSNAKLVVANNTSMSALLSLVGGKCSVKMPVGCTTTPCIPQSDVDTISSWINAGAKQQ